MQKNLLPYLNRLRNHEFAQAYHLICKELLTSESTQPNVVQAIEAIQSYSKEMIHLAAEQRTHPFTESVVAIKEKRHQALLSLRGRIAYLQRSPFDDVAKSAKTLRPWLEAHREFFRTATIIDQSRLVHNLSSTLEESTTLQAAVTKLGMLEDIMQLGALTHEIQSLDASRKKDWEADRVKAVQVRQQALKKLVALWRVLEVSVSLELEDMQEAKAMAHEINTVMIYFKRKHASKLTRRENQKQEQPLADEPIDNTDDSTEVDADELAPEPPIDNTPKEGEADAE